MIGTLKDISHRKEAEEALRESEEEVRALSQKIMHIAEEEKKHLAQDLHDEFGQVLTAFQLGVEMLKEHQFSDEEEYQFHCERLLKLVSRLDTDLRDMCNQLMPMLLDDIGLSAALDWHINQLSLLDTGLQIELLTNDQECKLTRDKEIALFRICQEALNNAIKHSEGQKVQVELDCRKDRVVMRISDDGIGIDLGELYSHRSQRRSLGLAGMRERAFAAGGTLLLESTPPKGTRINVELPTEGIPLGVGDDTDRTG